MGLDTLMVKRALQANYAWATQRMLRSRTRRWGIIIGADIVGIAVVLGTLRVVGAIISGAHIETASTAMERIKHSTTAQLPIAPNQAQAIAFADAKPIAEKALIAAPPRASRDLVFAGADVTGGAFSASPPAANRFSPPMSAERMNAAFVPSDFDGTEETQAGDLLRIWQPGGDPQVAALTADVATPSATAREPATDVSDTTVTPTKPTAVTKPKTRRVNTDTQVALVVTKPGAVSVTGSLAASTTGTVGAVAGAVGSAAQGAVGAVGGIAGGLGLGGH